MPEVLTQILFMLWFCFEVLDLKLIGKVNVHISYII